VVTSFNSDSDELARRLNTEAAKAVKYGGVSEEEALKFVTLNPAKQLKIDRWVGSLEVGKDADFVLWSGSPLSTYSRAEQTWVDGRKYFDRSEDLSRQAEVTRLREALIQKALPERQKALAATSPTPAATPKTPVTAEEIRYALEHESIYHDGQDRRNCSSVLDDHDL
jgi:adenine deaminase